MELERVRRFRSDADGHDAARERARAALSAAIEREGRRSRAWRRPLLVPVVLMLVAGLAAGSAFGLGERLRELFAGEPAPPPVTERLLDEARAERITPVFAAVPDVDPASARGVHAITTGGGPVVLWTVSTGGGAVCYPGAPVVWGLTERRVDGAPLRVVAGYVDSSIATLAVRSPAGETRPLTLAERFFLVELLDEREPHILVPRDAAGNALSEAQITAFSAEAMERFSLGVAAPSG